MHKSVFRHICIAVLWTAFTSVPFVRLYGVPMAGTTSDGAYVWATVQKSAEMDDCNLVIQATSGSWKKIIPEQPKTVSLAPNNRQLVIGLSKSTEILTLGTNDQTSIQDAVPIIARVRGSMTAVAGSLLFLRLNGPGNQVVLRDLLHGTDRIFPNVKNQVFAPSGNALALQTEETKEGRTIRTIQWVDLPNGKAKTVWIGEGEGMQSGNLVFDEGGTQLAFLSFDSLDSRIPVTIWQCQVGQEKAEVLVTHNSPGIEPGLVVGNSRLRFNPKGTRIFFKLRELELPKMDLKRAPLTIWSYLDAKPQSYQEKDLFPRWFLASVSLQDRRIARLEQANELSSGFDPSSSDYVLVNHFEGDVLSYSVWNNDDRQKDLAPSTYAVDEKWNPATQVSVWLVSTRDNSRILLRKASPLKWNGFPCFQFSPDSRYVFYYDEESKNYCSYEIAAGKTLNLTDGLNAEWNTGDVEGQLDEFDAPRAANNGPYGTALPVWLKDEPRVLVLDRYSDVWVLDLSGRNPAMNLTQGFALRNHFDFYFKSAGDVLNVNEPLMLEAHVNQNFGAFRDPGYYRLLLSRPGAPEVLIPVGSGYHWDGDTLRKGRQSVYISYRESVTEPPMPYFTRDFKTYTLLDDGRAQTRKGVRKELVSWTTTSGQPCQGLLFEPPDFDPNKKYPVVIEYYEKKIPVRAGNFSDVERSSVYLKDGYLVFLPDIHYIQGYPGQSTYECVVGGAKELMKRPFVDGTKMGIMGTSMGGYETNYLVTHSTLFAAAAEGSGVSDFVSMYGTLPNDEEGISFQEGCETGQQRLGGTPWSNREGYIENSPIFFADKVTTPLLIHHSRNDYRVPFGQGVEMFMALRRLGKPVWLLDYNDGHGGPGVDDKPAKDFTIRTKQFFDRYLKDALAPKWMTRGIPARMRGVDSGLELETEIQKP